MIRQRSSQRTETVRVIILIVVLLTVYVLIQRWHEVIDAAHHLISARQWL